MTLIERLRNYEDGKATRLEAAETLERLTDENALLHERHVFSNKILKEQQAALEATRAELAKYKDLIFKLQEWRADELAERDALKAALQLIKANTSRADWPDDINAAIQGAGK